MIFVPSFSRLLAGAVLFFAVVGGIRAQGTSHLLLDYDSQTGDFTYLNSALGTGAFYAAGYLGGNTIVANVEGGHIWFGHDAFNRPAEAAGAPLFTFSNTASTLNEVDYHATAVGHVLAGTGYVVDSDPEQFYLVGIGMAPYAGVWSGAVATEFSGANLGEFSTTTASTIAPYKAFFNGISGTNGVVRPDVINSSWGGEDPAGRQPETLAIDGLAAKNPTVAFVVSAGNSGTSTVGGPGSGYNNITVGSVGGATLRDPSEFSSRGAVDFFNPQTNTTHTGVRAGVDIAAPGENYVLAAYLGRSGSLGATTDPDLQAIVQESSATDLYFLEMDGTSFSAPIVAGGIALLKDVAKSQYYAAAMGAESLDSRVVKSVIMASAQETTGWNNGQQVNQDGVVVTTQALDFATGAGALDLVRAAGVYVNGTTDIVGTAGGNILEKGWDLGAVGNGLDNDYLFTTAFTDPTELTVSLNWFAGRTFANETDLGADLSFADLNLQIWRYAEGLSPLLVAESVSLYNNSEFLRLTLTAPGLYGISVVFEGMIFDLSPGVTAESYGLAWQAVAVPEPGTGLLVVIAGVVFAIRRRRGV